MSMDVMGIKKEKDYRRGELGGVGTYLGDAEESMSICLYNSMMQASRYFDTHIIILEPKFLLPQIMQ